MPFFHEGTKPNTRKQKQGNKIIQKPNIALFFKLTEPLKKLRQPLKKLTEPLKKLAVRVRFLNTGIKKSAQPWNKHSDTLSSVKTSSSSFPHAEGDNVTGRKQR